MLLKNTNASVTESEASLRHAEPVASVVPADDSPALDTGQRQGFRFRLDGIAGRVRETAPCPDRHVTPP